MLSLLLLVILLYASPLAAGLDFLFNSSSRIEFVFTGDATIDSSVIRLTSSRQQSMGRVFYPYPLPKNSRNMTTVSFATSFVFSIVPKDLGIGHGFAFVLSNTKVLPGALPSKYFGLFNHQSGPAAPPSNIQSNASRLLVVEFDGVKDPEFDASSSNRIGIDLNGPISSTTQEAAYYNSTTGEFLPVSMLSGNNIQAWIEFDGTHFGINVTIAPVRIPKPPKPLINFYDPEIANLVFGDMYVGFSASNDEIIVTQRILAWTLATDGALRDMNTSNLPVFLHENLSNFSPHFSVGVIGKVIIAVLAWFFFCFGFFGFYWFRIRRMIRSKDKDNDAEDEAQRWELDYWPHRYTYEELAGATNGFSEDQLLGYGGFGRVYKGTELINDNNNRTIAVKCINSDSKQGFKEFMAEISSIGRLQHKNLVRMRGWCKKGKEMLLVYDYMPNGSLYSWIFTKSETLSWQRRLIVLIDIAEGLNYLHNGWDHLVLHRDIKSSNVLLDADMRGRLGDFGLAKLCKHGQSLSMTNLVGTIGYMAPELVRSAPTKASDIYSFGVLLLEVVCGRRPTDLLFPEFESRETILIDWLRMLQKESRLNEAADLRVAGEYNVGDLEMVLNLGLAACDAEPELRPSMKEVLSSLMSLKLPASTEYFSSCNYSNQEEETSRISRVSFITEPGPRT